MTVQSGKNKLERFFALNMCKWETGWKSLPLVFCVLWKVAALIIRPSVCAAPPPGLWQRKAFYFSNLPVSPLANLEAITSDSTMSYGPILLQEKHVGRNAASSECKVGETGISHSRQSWQEKERRGKKETTKGNQDTGQDGTRALSNGSAHVCAHAGLCTCGCVQTHQGKFGLVTRQGVNCPVAINRAVSFLRLTADSVQQPSLLLNISP